MAEAGGGAAAPAVPVPVLPQDGPAIDRVDGRLKVTGAATYAYEYGGREYDGPEPLVGFVVPSTIARGRIRSLDTAAAEAAPGVRLVLSHRNAPPQAPWGPLDAKDRFARAQPACATDEVRFYGDPVALVVADSFEQARAAAYAIKVEYDREAADTRLVAAQDGARPPATMGGGAKATTAVGDAGAAFKQAAFTVDAAYDTPYQNHNPMEPVATLAHWVGPKLSVWCSSQVVDSHQSGLAATLQMSKSNVRVVSRYIGGGFGGKLPYHADQVLAALAAKLLDHPVKIAFTRQQMAQSTTHRTATLQRIRLGAGSDGRLVAMSHDSVVQCARFDNYTENVAQPTRGLYGSPNISTSNRLAKLDLPRSDSMRAPGDTPGSIALECAMDELAHAAGIDPVELRLRNDTQSDPTTHLPYTSRKLAECLRAGAARFGWAQRPTRPGTLRDGNWLRGFGVASAFRGNMLRKAAAEARMGADGRLTVRLAMTDIGTGTYTILTEIAAESMGLPPAAVTVVMGDTDFPPTSGSGGSFGAETSGSAVFRACESLRDAIATAAIGDPRSPLHGAAPEAVRFAGGRIEAGGTGEAMAAVVARSAPNGMVARGSVETTDGPKGHAEASFGAHFAEVAVDATTGEVRMRRMTGVFAVARVLNPKTLRSQLMGGMLWGMSSALIEGNDVDGRSGAFAARDLSTYHVPIQADVGAVEVVVLDERDPSVNPIGVKGAGELGICGSAAAVMNAVFNATGVRVRSAPLTPDKLLAGLSAA